MGQRQGHPITFEDLSSAWLPAGPNPPAVPRVVSGTASEEASGASLSQGLRRQTRHLQRLAALTYPEFLAHIRELNAISSRFLDANGKQLVFAVQRGTDTSIFWKATAKVACVKIDAQSKSIDSYRTLGVPDFILVYHKLQSQAAALGTAPTAAKVQLDAELEDWVDSAHPVPTTEGLDECCICLERRSELILPCAHSFCAPCIEQWHAGHHTCPICRENVSSTDDGWVVYEEPDSLEIATDIQKLLMDLTQ